MYGRYSNIHICGIQSAVSSRIVDNAELAEKIASKSISKFVQYTGIKRRHLLNKGQTATDLSTYAAKMLFDRLGWDKNDIRVIVNVTQAPDLEMPSTAMILQKRLGIGTDCIAFDVNHGCAAYVIGLQIVSSLLQNTGGKALLFTADGMYYDMSENPNPDSLLFGDGAAVTAVELKDDYPFMYSQNTDGSRFDLLYRKKNGDMVMDGNAVMLFTLNEVADSIRMFKDHFEIEDSLIDFYVPHQAQGMIVNGIIDECNLPADRVLTAYAEYGNTSSASLPITICHNRETIRNTGKDTVKVLLSGFGTGLTWSNIYLHLDTNSIGDIAESDIIYERYTK